MLHISDIRKDSENAYTGGQSLARAREYKLLMWLCTNRIRKVRWDAINNEDDRAPFIKIVKSHVFSDVAYLGRSSTGNNVARQTPTVQSRALRENR